MNFWKQQLFQDLQIRGVREFDNRTHFNNKYYEKVSQCENRGPYS